jgi:peptidoglycan/LPS O-acetylase OafA/YrhL
MTIALIGSLAAQTWLFARYDVHPFDIWLFPLPLWCFMIGALAYHAYARLRAIKPRWLMHYALGATAAAFALTITYNLFGTPRLLYLFAIATCLPGVVLLGRHNPLDDALGELSYPVYLIHPLATIMIITGKWGEYIAIAAILLVSWVVTRAVERPVDRYRQYRARRKSQALLSAPSLFSSRPTSVSPLHNS